MKPAEARARARFAESFVKCAGIRCTVANQCERYTRKTIGNRQQWASFYAMGAAAMQLPCEEFISNQTQAEAA